MAIIKPEQLRSGFYNITGSLFGTSSYADFALTASYALNTDDPFRIVTGSVTASVSTGQNIFLITNNNTTVLAVSQSGVVVFATQSQVLTDPAPNGGIYFTSASFFVGLD